MSKSECIFCRIVEGTIPSARVLETERFVAFLDAFPKREGHTLVVPKEHHRWVWDVQNIGEYFETCQRVANALRKAYRTEWVVSLIFGEEILHAHISLIPRTPDDGHGNAIDLRKRMEPSTAQLQEIAERIKTFL